MARVHFTTEDLMGITVATAPDPLCEVLFSLDVLRNNGDELLYGHWRHRTQARLSSHMRSSPQLRELLGISLAKLSRTSSAPRARAMLHHVLASRRSPSPPAGRTEPDNHRPVARWIDELADDHPTTLRLADALSVYWRAGLEPYWDVMLAHVQADAERRVRAILAGGLSRLLATLHPEIGWHPPVMHVSNPVDHDILLDGHGLVLLPSFFCWPGPVLIQEGNVPGVLIYPVGRTPGWGDSLRGYASQAQTLALLLGRTRAAVLEAASLGHNTTEIARSVGVSLPTASQHTSILRDAGLITSRRHGNILIHEISGLGLALLNGKLPP